MLKYDEIIKQLSERDKIQIVSDIKALSDSKYRMLDIPAVKIESMDGSSGDTYPSFVSLANTWNTELVGAVAGELAGRMSEKGINVARIRGPKIKIDPYRVSVSEDPLLASRVVSEATKAAANQGMNVALSDFAIRSDETKWLDTSADERFIYEYIVAPYMLEGESAGVCSLLSRCDIRTKGYEKINSSLASKACEAVSGAKAICEDVPSEKTVRYISDGGICFSCSSVALDSALHRYNVLKKAISLNTSTEEELEEEMRNGRAMSPEMLDAAVDRLLDFVFSVKKEYVPLRVSPQDDLAYKVAVESTVLLKNEKLLPIKPKGQKVAVIGDIVGDDLLNSYKLLLENEGMNVTGIDSGYDFSSNRSEEYAEKAAGVAQNADIVLAFFGLGEDREKRAVKTHKITLPANQLDLLSRLEKCGSKVIAVVCGDVCADIGYHNSCAALLYAPMQAVRNCKAFADMIFGRISPSGRLANTVYFDSEELYYNKRKAALRDNLKTGPFVGYRYYDTAGIYNCYPFGYGLSFTSFHYSKIKLNNDHITLTVKNTGKIAAADVIQIYVGAVDSKVIRPLKELAGFKKVFLNPGESREISVPFVVPRVYDSGKKSFAFERCAYDVYLCRSVNDVRFKTTVNAGEGKIEADGNVLCDYIQTESNIISGKYKLEENFITMKKRSVFNFIAGGLTLALAMCLKLYCVFENINAKFFDIFSVALGVTGIVFLVSEIVQRNRAHREYREELDRLVGEEYKEAEEVNFYAADKMFVNEFDIVAKDEKEDEMKLETEDIDAQYHLYIDSEQSFEKAARDFALFALEKGYKFDEDTVNEIFSSLASSRLIVLRNMQMGDFKDLLVVLGGYFESSAYIDKYNRSYSSPEAVLFTDDSQGNREKTNICNCLEAARNKPQSIHFAGLYGAKLEGIEEYFAPFISYAKNPHASCNVVVRDQNYAETTYYIPQNVWFVIGADENESMASMPYFITETAAVSGVKFSRTSPVSNSESLRKFSYYQLTYLMEKLGNKFEIEEDDWKKIDKLEEYVGKYTEYSIGNKMWLGLEKYAVVYLACGGEDKIALDKGIGTKLLPSMITALRGKVSREEKSFSEVIEEVLGEDSADFCKEQLKAFGWD